jgi:antitoxin Phd
MAEARWSLQEAKNRLSTVVAAARRGQPQLVTKHGRPAAVVLAVEDYERLKALEGTARPSFVDLLLALPQDDGAFERLPLEPRPLEL